MAFAILPLILLIIFALIGAGFGVITGLIPGLHVNNLALILLSLSPILLSMLGFLTGMGLSEQFVIVLLCGIIISISISHTFHDFIPSTFLGAPEADTALSVLPAHSMLLEGKGYNAVKLSAIGSLAAVMVAIVIIFPFRFIVGPPINGYDILKQVMVFLLILIFSVLILTESSKIAYRRAFHVESITGKQSSKATHNVIVNQLEPAHWQGRHMYWGIKGSKRILIKDSNKLLKTYDRSQKTTMAGYFEPTPTIFSRTVGILAAMFVFILSGMLGYVVFQIGYVPSYFWPAPQLLPMMMPPAVLFPLLSGLFGIATLVESLRSESFIPPQKIEEDPIEKGKTAKSIISGALAGSAVGFLPGMTSGTATIMAMLGRKEPEREQVIVTLSAINTSNAFFVLIALFLILRPRSGAAIIVDELLQVEQWSGILLPQALSYLIICGLVAAIFAFFTTIAIGKWAAVRFHLFPYRKVVIGIIIFIIVMVFVFTGWLGLVILAVATCVGFIPQELGIRRSHAMGVLLLPVILMLW